MFWCQSAQDISQSWSSGGKTCADKNFGAKRPLVTVGERFECSRLEDLPGSSRENTRQSINLLALLCQLSIRTWCQERFWAQQKELFVSLNHRRLLIGLRLPGNASSFSDFNDGQYFSIVSFVRLESIFVKASNMTCLAIPSEIQAVQDVIYPLINHAFTSDHLSGPILLGHLELRLDFLPLGFVTKPTAYR